MFILTFALSVMVICMVITFFNKNLTKEYFNIDDSVKQAKFTGYAAMVYMGIWVLSFLILPVVVVLPFVHLVVCALSWWWLISTIQSGHVAVWIKDAKEYVNK